MEKFCRGKLIVWWHSDNVFFLNHQTSWLLFLLDLVAKCETGIRFQEKCSIEGCEIEFGGVGETRKQWRNSFFHYWDKEKEWTVYSVAPDRADLFPRGGKILTVGFWVCVPCGLEIICLCLFIFFSSSLSPALSITLLSVSEHTHTRASVFLSHSLTPPHFCNSPFVAIPHTLIPIYLRLSCYLLATPQSIAIYIFPHFAPGSRNRWYVKVENLVNKRTTHPKIKKKKSVCLH